MGLKTNEEVFEAIIKCWASLYSFQSVLYRKQNIQAVVSSIAVVIQKMVQAESAGVLFSKHFLNGDPSVIIVTANYGLGESVVSAKSEPDTYLIRRSYRGDDVTMLASIPGDKKFIIEMGEESSVVEKSLDEEMRKKLCLTEDVVLRLAKIAIVLEKFFGNPQDIEFAVTKDKRIFLLQSRSITALNNFTEYEIAHETDSAVMSNWDIFTRANVGEVLNGAMSKLSKVIITKTIDKLNVEIKGLPNYSPLYDHLLHCFNDTIFMDVYHQFLDTTEDQPTVMNRALSLAIFGGDVYSQYPQIMEIAIHKNSMRNKFRDKMQLFKFIIDSMFLMDGYRKNMVEALERMKLKLAEQNLLKYKTSSDVVDLIMRELDNFNIIIRGHMKASSFSAFSNALVFAVLTQGSKELTTDHQRDVTIILSSIGNIESANIPEMIRELAEAIKSSGKENAFLEINIDKSLEWLSLNAKDAYELFKKFMERHGHRALKEFDLKSKTWAMQPEKVIEMIKANLRCPSGSTSEVKKKLSDDEIISQLKTPLSNMSQKILKKLIKKCHSGVQYRESAKSQLIEAVNELRRTVLYLSKKMVNEGFLPEQDLVYHLTIEEIRAIIKNRDSTHISKAFRRRKMYAKHDELLFDEICFGIPQPMSELDNSIEIKEGDIIVKG